MANFNILFSMIFRAESNYFEMCKKNSEVYTLRTDKLWCDF